MNSGCFTSEFAKHMTNKYCLCLSTYVSAFGFVGFILFCFFNVDENRRSEGTWTSFVVILDVASNLDPLETNANMF